MEGREEKGCFGSRDLGGIVGLAGTEVGQKQDDNWEGSADRQDVEDGGQGKNLEESTAM